MESTRNQDERNRKGWLAVLLVLLLLLLMLALLFWWLIHPHGDTGSRLIPMGNITVEEAREQLDNQMKDDRITVSLSPLPAFDESSGDLRVNFIVDSDNNGYAERLEVVQDGHIVYSSGIVQPGFCVEWANAPAAHAGEATATVYAVDKQGNDYGNPVSAEISIVAK